MVGEPAHGPRVDVVQLVACTRARRALVALAVLKQLLFSCFSIHYSAGRQARQLHSMTGATWVLQNTRLIKKNCQTVTLLNCSLMAKIVLLSKLTCNYACKFTQSLHSSSLLKINTKFTQSVPGGFSQEKHLV